MRKKWTKAAAVLLSATMIAGLAGCGSKEAESTEVTEAAEETTETSEAAGEETTEAASGERETGMADSVTIALSSDCGDLAPWTGGNGSRGAVIYNIYETLAVMETRGEDLVPVIMKSYEEVEDRVYDIEIWDNIYDTDGNHMTAEDVAWCYQQIIGSSTFAREAPLMSAEAVDDYVVEFKFSESMGLSTLDICMYDIPLVTKAAYEASADGMATQPVGTKGYIVKSFTPGSTIELEYAGSYWQDDALTASSSAHNVKNITYQIITEASQHAIALETGTVDTSTAVAEVDMYHFQEGGDYAENYSIEPYTDNLVDRLYLNCNPGGLLDNVDLRKAICYALDNDGINDVTYGGRAYVAKVIGSRLCMDYNEAWETEGCYEYDPDAAKEALTASGYNGETLRLLVRNEDDYKTMAQMVQSYLGEVGINVEVTSYESAILDTIIDDPDTWEMLIDCCGTEDYIVNDWGHWMSAEAYYGHTKNFVYDDKLQEMYSTCASVEGYSEELTNEIWEYVKENAYIYPLVQDNLSLVYNSSKIAELKYDYKGNIYPNACIYYVD